MILKSSLEKNLHSVYNLKFIIPHNNNNNNRNNNSNNSSKINISNSSRNNNSNSRILHPQNRNSEYS